MKRGGPGKYTRRTTAAVKAACAAGVPLKMVARVSGVPLHTLRPWTMGLAHKDVRPCPRWRDEFYRLGKRLFL